MAKEVAVTILDTLTVADSFAVVAFSTLADQLGGTNLLIEVNSANKDCLKAEINQLEPDGQTNFRAAFTTAFDAIDNMLANKGMLVNGPIAFQFMTDGKLRNTRITLPMRKKQRTLLTLSMIAQGSFPKYLGTLQSSLIL